MYPQINPTETFRERHLALLREAKDKRRARRLRVPKAARAWCLPHKERMEREMNQTIDKRTSGTGWSTKTLLGACLMVVAALMAACLMGAQPAHASSTFTVNSTADTEDATPDGACNSCTLREAIQEANATVDADTINFNIPEALRDPNTDVVILSPQTQLPRNQSGDHKRLHPTSGQPEH